MRGDSHPGCERDSENLVAMPRVQNDQDDKDDEDEDYTYHRDGF